MIDKEGIPGCLFVGAEASTNDEMANRQTLTMDFHCRACSSILQLSATVNYKPRFLEGALKFSAMGEVVARYNKSCSDFDWTQEPAEIAGVYVRHSADLAAKSQSVSRFYCSLLHSSYLSFC